MSSEKMTDWTMIYNFNFVFGMILAVQSLFALISVCVPKLRGCVGCCNCCCTGIVNLVMCIMTVVYANNDFGEACGMQDVAYFGPDAPPMW